MIPLVPSYFEKDFTTNNTIKLIPPAISPRTMLSQIIPMMVMITGTIAQ